MIPYSVTSEPHRVRSVRQPAVSSHQWLSAIALLPALLAVLMVNGRLASTMIGELEMNDFGVFYHSAVAFRNGDPLYVRSPTVPVSEQVAPAYNLNPPHFTLLMLPLARLPAGWALSMWALASVLALGWCVYRIVSVIGLDLSPPGWMLAALALLGSAAITSVVATGQVTLILAPAITEAWLAARRGHPVVCGALLGVAVSFKAFLLIFVPVLLLRRQFRSAAALVVIASAIFVCGVMIFGLEAHRAWVDALWGARWTWLSQNASILGFLSRIAADNPVYPALVDARSLILPMWLLAAGTVGTLLVIAVARERSVDRVFALTLLSALLMSPLGWIYYLAFALGPVVAVLANSRPFLTTRLHGIAGAVAVAGILCPPGLDYVLKAAPIATLVLRSAHFWGLLALWTLVYCLDARVDSPTDPGAPDVSFESPTSVSRRRQ